MDPIVIVLAFSAGLLMRSAGYPPMLGYLVAGFVANAMHFGSGEALAPLADAGVTLLLFTIGLKLNLQTLKPRYVWASAFLHMVIAVPLTAAVIMLVGTLYAPLALSSSLSAWALAFALSFSSTVFAIKLCEERGESASFYASIAIGVLVVQDVMAVIYLAVASGKYPTPWALALLSLIFITPFLQRIMRAIGHGELLLFSGIAFALTTAELFEFVNIKGGLGALLIGVLVAKADRLKAKELYDKLVGLKNLLLIGFFLQIGYYGFPSLMMIVVACVLSFLLVLRPVIYFSLFALFGLRARTSWFSGMLLFNYSEFGLIVAAASVQAGILTADWVTTLALAMALSFFIATPINKQVHRLYLAYRSQLLRYERGERLPEEEIGSLGDVDTAVLGMGRVGRNAYQALKLSGQDAIVGVEESFSRTRELEAEGFHCVHGDASDRDFWERTDLAQCKLILVGLSNHRENLQIVKLAKELGYNGQLAVAARYSDHRDELEALGCISFNLYEEVGKDFATHTLSRLEAAKNP